MANMAQKAKATGKLVVEQGLCFKPTLDGRGSWQVNYWVDGREKRFTLARGDQLTKAQARKLADEIQVDARRGIHPKKAKRSGSLIKDVVAQFLDQEGDRLRALSKRRRDLGRWVSAYGDRTMAEVRGPDVLELLAQMKADSKKRGQGTSAADDAFKAFRILANWYAPRHEDYRNPIVRGLYKVTPKRRERTLTDAELLALWSCTDTDHPYHLLCRFLTLTPVRLEEAASMLRAEVSSDGVWTIPAGKAGKQHTLPLSPWALELLRSVPVVEGSPYVFTIRGTNSINGWDKFAQALRKRMAPVLGVQWDQHDWWTHHDLRRLFSTRMNENLLAAGQVIEACEAHVVAKGTEAHYNRARFFQPMREALAKWADYVAGIVEPQRIRKAEPLSVPIISLHKGA